MDSHKLNFGKTEFVVVAPKTHAKHQHLILRMNGQIVKQKKSAKLLGLYITWNMDHKFYIQDMENSLLSGLSQRLAMLTIMAERAGIRNRKQFAFGLIYSRIIRIVMNKKMREMRVLDLYRCLKWHTLDILMMYHDYLLFFSIITYRQPGNLKTGRFTMSQILPSNAELLRQGNKIVKKENTLFIEPITEGTDNMGGQNNANMS